MKFKAGINFSVCLKLLLSVWVSSLPPLIENPERKEHKGVRTLLLTTVPAEYQELG